MIAISNDPAERNRQICTGIQATAEAKLGRELTADKAHRIWNLGSFLLLELVDRSMESAKTRKDVEKILADIPTNKSTRDSE